LVTGVVLRLAALALLADKPLEGDALSYHETALDLLGGGRFEPHWPPGVPAMLALAYWVFGSSWLTARSVMVLVYLAFSAALLGVGRRVGGPRVANLALAVFAVTPIFVWSSVNTLTQLPTAALALGAAYFGHRCLQGEKVWASAGLLGCCLAGLLLTRPSNVAMFVVLPLYLAWRRARWQTVVVPVAVVTFFTGAWSLKAYSLCGHFVFINAANAQNIFYGNNPWTPLYRTWWYGSHKEPGDMPPDFEAKLREINHDPKTRDAQFVKVAMDHIKDRPDLFVLRTVNRVRVFMGFDTFTSAQVSRSSKKLAALVLAIDAGLYLLTTIAAMLLPLAILSPALGWPALMKSAGGSGSAEAWAEVRLPIIKLLLLLAFLYAFPYFFAFSHPTFHVAATALLGPIGALAGVGFLEGGLGPAWKAAPARVRVWTAVALAAYLAIQIEWAAAVLQRAG
jgi:4-amino-4-deoxy-L-arabinose transferase-like glycosyltransferase